MVMILAGYIAVVTSIFSGAMVVAIAVVTASFTLTTPGHDAPATLPVSTAPATQPAQGTIRVQAQIDGLSDLRVRGAIVQWFHLDQAVPGHHGNNDEPTWVAHRW
jgi:hypothetical protein